MFQRVILPEASAPGPERVRSLGMTATAHALLVAALLAASYAALEMPRDPPEPADFTLTFDVPEPRLAETRRVPPPPRARPEPRPEPVPEKAPEPPPKPQVAEAARPVVMPRALPHVDDAPEPEDVPMTGRASGGSPPPLAVPRLAPAIAPPDEPEIAATAPGRPRGEKAPLLAGDGNSRIVAYAGGPPPEFFDRTLPAAGEGGRGTRRGSPSGVADGTALFAGGGTGGGAVRYGSPDGDPAGDGLPGGAPGGKGRGGRGGGSGTGYGAGTGAGHVPATLGRYGLALVSVGDLGARSTEAARWNMIVPRLAELLRAVIAHGATPHGGGNVVSVQRDGNTLIVRYSDGVVHVMVPTADGLAALYVARTAGARPVVSRIEEGESALAALARLNRGDS